MGLIDYIDTKRVTIEILKDWHDQHWKADQKKKEILEIDRRMTSLTSALGSNPVKGGSSKTEEMLCASIDKKTVAEHGLRLAKEYIAEIGPAWNRLTEDEKFYLSARFIDYDERNGIDLIMRKYNISKTEAYNRSNDALGRLSKLVFWR